MSRHIPIKTETDPLDLSDCPWFQGTGHCSHQCQTEPSCETDRPEGGWPGEVMVRREPER